MMLPTCEGVPGSSPGSDGFRRPSFSEWPAPGFVYSLKHLLTAAIDLLPSHCQLAARRDFPPSPDRDCSW